MLHSYPHDLFILWLDICAFWSPSPNSPFPHGNLQPVLCVLRVYFCFVPLSSFLDPTYKWNQTNTSIFQICI